MQESTTTTTQLDRVTIESASPLPLVYYPAAILSHPCDVFADRDPTIRAEVAGAMIATMRKYQGVGLAGPQVGIPQQVAVVEPYPGDISIIFNPTLLEWEADNPFTYSEGCLSVPGHYETRTRAGRISVVCEDVFGDQQTLTFEGLAAFAVQHELDHLRGKLFIDDLSRLKKDRIRRKVEKHVNK